MDRILKEERKYIAGLIKKIVASGANVLLIQKSILRDATNDLSLHFLAKKGIMVVKDIEREEVEFISKVIFKKLYYYNIFILFYYYTLDYWSRTCCPY